MKKDELFNTFQTLLTGLASNNAQFTIALSGGLDSIVLLHLFSRLKTHKLIAHHVHHGLSEHADYWATFCQKTALNLNVKCIVSHVTLDKKNRISLEALAREARYHALKQSLTDHSYLVTAHHQDDQLETVLLALKRGAGLTGLQGIVVKQDLDPGYLLRPLLDFSREQLECYASNYELEWIEDESNQDQRFDRNFIRHTITPLLKERWPAIGKTVARSASHCQAQQGLIDEITEADFVLCQASSLVLSIDELKKLSEARRKNVLRSWFKISSLNYPSTKQLSAIWDNVALAKEDAEPKLTLQGHTLQRYRNALYLNEEGVFSEGNERLIWQGEDKISLCEGQLILNIALENDLTNQCHHHVEVCFRDNLTHNFKCRPLDRDKKRSIKKLLHEYRIPPWQRGRIPFVFVDGELLEAVGVFKCETALSHLFRISMD